MVGEAARQAIDLCSIERATGHARESIRAAMEEVAGVVNDPRKAERLEACECTFCFYMRSARIGGARDTERPCGICGGVVRSGSTCIDVICRGCARANGLCKHCGADIKLNSRRKFAPAGMKREAGR